ncbi:hypothetical protein BDZ97DRAFT_1930033 [Flammula alnicola]|nr:hypothetical protein BDZ97DRAFT_1930033 [Flammula alnicola]
MPSGQPADNAQVFQPELQHFAGHCPPSSYFEAWVNDYHNSKLYMVGGVHSGDCTETPASDFFCCDTTSMTWTNLSNNLRVRNPYKPFSEENRKPQLKLLPSLILPGTTLVRIENASFILIFGGFDCDKNEPSSKVIMIDPEEKEWWYLKFDGEDVGPRINPAVVAVDNKMYIFGGYQTFGNDPRPYRSFSIAECKPEGVWHWEVRDAPISPSIPRGHVFGNAISVYNGTKILLGPGNLTDNKSIRFSKNQFFFYHTINKKFQRATAEVTGVFPQDAICYSMYEYHRPTSTSPVIVLGPEERIERLNVDQTLRNLRHNFEEVVCVEGRVWVLGTGPSHRRAAPANVPQAGDQYQTEVDTDAQKSDTWCTYLDIPLDKL